MKKIDTGIKELNFDKGNMVVLENDNDPNDVIEFELLNFVHKGNVGEFNLDFLRQSEGTCSFIEKLMIFFTVLDKGGLVIIDEIDNSLHPLLLIKLISLFADSEINTKNAQLIFSTHQPLLMADRSKNQIYLVEKDENLASKIFRLDDLKGIGNWENFPVKYLNGEYGGIADLGVF